MKTLPKYHVCNHCVIGEKTFQNILVGPDKLPGLSRNGPQDPGDGGNRAQHLVYRAVRRIFCLWGQPHRVLPYTDRVSSWTTLFSHIHVQKVASKTFEEDKTH